MPYANSKTPEVSEKTSKVKTRGFYPCPVPPISPNAQQLFKLFPMIGLETENPEPALANSPAFLSPRHTPEATKTRTRMPEFVFRRNTDDLTRSTSRYSAVRLLPFRVFFKDPDVSFGNSTGLVR
ncbi:MAG: hypothetical protein LBD71_00795 [Treponema sp.]|nr:hypothetical protein [Treponema sp.]